MVQVFSVQVFSVVIACREKTEPGGPSSEGPRFIALPKCLFNFLN